MKKELIALMVLLLVSFLIIIFHNIGPLKFLTSAVDSIFAAPNSALYNLKTSFSGNDSSSVKKLEDENAALIKKMVDYNNLKNDNDALRNQFETTSTATYKLVPARVLGALDNISNPDSLIVDGGSSSGVKIGMAAIFKNELIGKVVEVSAAYSKVALVTNTSFSALGKTSENGTLGIIRGQNDFILLDNVSINDKISKNEIVTTKGEINASGIGVPPDLIVGKIAAVSRSESQPFQTAKVVSDINFGQLTDIFIVKGY